MWMVLQKIFMVEPIKFLSHRYSFGKPWIKGAVERDIIQYRQQLGIEWSYSAAYEIW